MELTVQGQRAVLRHLTTTLPDGDTGYYQRSATDCLRAAVATVLQLPYRQVPELPDVAAMARWGAQMGYRVDRHSWRPVARRWIGVELCPGQPQHMVVMAYAQQYFDPASGWEFDGGLRAPAVQALEYGLTLEAAC